MTNPTATPDAPPDEELTASQAAKEFGVPQRVLQYAAQRDLIPNRRVGNAYLLNRQGCADYAMAYKSRRRGQDRA